MVKGETKRAAAGLVAVGVLAGVVLYGFWWLLHRVLEVAGLEQKVWPIFAFVGIVTLAQALARWGR